MLTKEQIYARKLRLVELALTMTPQNEALADRLEQITLCDMALAHLKASKQEPVAVKQPSDPYDERDGLWFTPEDIARLKALPARTKLYAAPVPAKSPWVQFETEGYVLAMAVMQSDLYNKLDDKEKADCDVLIRRGMHKPKSPEEK